MVGILFKLEIFCFTIHFIAIIILLTWSAKKKSFYTWISCSISKFSLFIYFYLYTLRNMFWMKNILFQAAFLPSPILLILAVCYSTAVVHSLQTKGDGGEGRALERASGSRLRWDKAITCFRLIYVSSQLCDMTLSSCWAALSDADTVYQLTDFLSFILATMISKYGYTEVWTSI